MTHIIHCIGDSHVSFFSGNDAIQPGYPELADDRIPCFRTYRLGPTLAYSLASENTRTRGREKLFEIVHKLKGAGAHLLLCFGEIDCRYHLLKQSEQQQRPIDAVVKECTRRYTSVVDEIRPFFSGDIYIYNVIPSSREEIVAEFPTYGTCEERNHVSRLFNQNLATYCEQTGVHFVSIFDVLLASDGLTNMDYYMDQIHLSQKAQPLVMETLSRVGYKPGAGDMLRFRGQSMLWKSAYHTRNYHRRVANKLRHLIRNGKS